MKRTSVIIISLLLVVSATAQRELSIAQVQGDGNLSPFSGQHIRVTGVVTARIRTGFFLQTPDDKIDQNKNTSEGVFVFTRIAPPAEAAVGNLVSVTGSVEEFRRDNEPFALTITEISMRQGRDDVRVISKSNSLPAAIVMTASDFMSNSVDNLERYEGMRVRFEEMTVCSPTNGRVDSKSQFAVSDGAFYAVIKPVPRPFREPGRDIREIAESSARERFQREYPKAAIFDSNPEIVRVDTDEQMLRSAPGSSGEQDIFGKPLNVAAGMAVSNLVGVLHYSFGKYTLLTDPEDTIAVSGAPQPNRLPVPTERQLVVVGMNLENFFDDEDDPSINETIVTTEAFARRMKKISITIVGYMHLPDIIGVVEVENLAALKRLAAKLNADAVASGKPDPKYEAFLIEGNDARGIDNGFLVKTSRLRVVETVQHGKRDKYKNPNTKEDNFLNDRPPLLLRASLNDEKTGRPFEITVVVNHMKSYLGYNDPKQQDNVRLKKKLQAEFLARLIQSRQAADPKERIVLLGDFNSYQFADGIMDMIGTIIGKPAGPEAVLIASDDFVNPDLINLVDVIAAAQRYSYIFDGNAQVLDHIIISETMRKHTTGFGYARINADYPEVLRNDANRMERFSDHDPAVAYFTLDDLTAARVQ